MCYIVPVINSYKQICDFPELVKEVKISKDGETEKVKKLLDLFVQSQDEGKWNTLNEVLENIGELIKV